MMDEHLIINVEAGLALSKHREGDADNAAAEAMMREADELDEQAAAATDAFVRARFQRDAQKTRMRALERKDTADVKYAAAAKMVQAASSLPDNTDPAALQPISRTPLTEAEVKEREELATSSAWASLRADRDGLLAGSDWTQQPDAPVDREAWAKYRSQLRDLPANTKDPAAAKWPQPPED